MSKFNAELLSVLSGQLPQCRSLAALDAKHNLNLFNILTPGMITSIDYEVNADPFILSESISLLETASHLSFFYADEDFLDLLKGNLIKIRSTWRNRRDQNKDPVFLQKGLMEEYFVTDPDEMIELISTNPVYLGIYLYLFLRTVVVA